MKCTLSISRPTVSGVSDSVIELVLRIERGKTITVPVSPADFALAVTGKSDVPAELRLRGVSVMPAGMVATALQDLRDRATSAEVSQDDIPVAMGNFVRDAYEQARREGRGEREAFDYAVSAIRAKAFDDLCSAFVKHASVSGLDDGDSITVREATDALLHCAEQLREGEIK